MDRQIPLENAQIQKNRASASEESDRASDNRLEPKRDLPTGEAQRDRVVELIACNEDDLISRILAYAKEREYTKYTSTLREAWRLSIHDLSETLIDSLSRNDKELELHPDEDYTKDPITQFGITEAQRHRERGISLSMFLGLFKYYRQSYRDFIHDSALDRRTKQEATYRLDRIFDRIEIGLVTEWTALSADHFRVDLQDTNRRLTNEKNHYLTVIESLATPILFLDVNRNIVLINQAANSLFALSRIPGSFYYRQKFVDVALPTVLKDKIASFERRSAHETSFEYDHNCDASPRFFRVYIKRMLDVSDKFTGIVMVFNDITSIVKAEKALREREQRYRYITESMSDFVYMLEIDERDNPTTEWIAGAIKSITGYTAKEVRSMVRGYLSLIRSSDIDLYPLRLCGDEQKRQTIVEYRILNKNGEERWIRDHIKSLRDTSNNVIRLFGAVQDITRQKRAEAEIKSLKGILPICASCKKIRNDSGYWQRVEEYIHEHSEAEFSHGLCPDCVETFYSDAEELNPGSRSSK